MSTSSSDRGRPRICRTDDEAFAAGRADGKNDPPMTPEQRTKIVALLAPYRHLLLPDIQPPAKSACDPAANADTED